MPLLPLIVLAQSPQTGLSLREDYIKREVMVPMRDGARLHTAVYAPKDQTRKWPVLIVRTPYSATPYGEGRFPNSLGPTREFVRRGYVFVVQDVRGKWLSEGTHVFSPPPKPDRGPQDHDESTDNYDTVEWLLKNVPNHNGRVGVWGISQPGFYASNTLLYPHPAMVAVSPQAPVTDRFKGDDDHHNGAFFLGKRFPFLWSFGYPRPVPTTKGAPPFKWPHEDGYRFYLEMGPLANAQRYFQWRNQFWNQVMAHGTYDEFWQSRGMEPFLRRAPRGPAVLVVGGWFDAENLYGALKTYGALQGGASGPRTSIVMGPWSHGQWSGEAARLGSLEFGAKTGEWYQQNVVLPWFEHHLRGAEDPKLPEALMYDTGTNQWQRFEVWPPANATAAQLWIRERGGLAWEPGRSGWDAYVSDPRRPVPHSATANTSTGVRNEYMVESQRFAWERPDVLSYVSPPLEKDVTLAGPIEAKLQIRTTATDADFVIKLIDVYPDDAPTNTAVTPNVRMAGYQLPVRMEIMRAKFRESLSEPKPLEPGKPQTVSLALNDVLHTFKKGHRLMVQIQSSWFPLVDRNPQTFTNIYQAKESDFRAATHQVLFGPSGTRLNVSVLP